MRNFLKAIGYILLCFVAVVAVNIYSFYQKGVHASSSTPEGQTYEIVDGKPVFHSKLVARSVVKITVPRVCDQEMEALTRPLLGDHEYGVWCANGKCDVTFDFGDGKIPETVDISARKTMQDRCKTETVATKDHIVPAGYQTRIGINGELKDLFSKTQSRDGLKKLPETKASGLSSFGMNGNYSLTLDYKEPVESDTFLFHGMNVKVFFSQ